MGYQNCLSKLFYHKWKVKSVELILEKNKTEEKKFEPQLDSDVSFILVYLHLEEKNFCECNLETMRFFCSKNDQESGTIFSEIRASFFKDFMSTTFFK